jgi:hypothetical protein
MLSNFLIRMWLEMNKNQSSESRVRLVNYCMSPSVTYKRQLHHCCMGVLSVKRNKVTQYQAMRKCNTLPIMGPVPY